MRMSHVIQGTCPVTTELALLCGRAFDPPPQNWLNLQTAYDLTMAEASLDKLLNNVHCWRMRDCKTSPSPFLILARISGGIRTGY